jgi:PhnB protein
MPQPIPYLSFPGNCADAMRFYETTLGARLTASISYGDAPMPEPMPAEARNLIMHAHLALADGGELMAGDCPPGMPFEGFKGVMLALTYAEVAAAERVFTALGEGGQVTMPMAPTFWAKTFGMVTDRFGVSWGVNGAVLPMPVK